MDRYGVSPEVARHIVESAGTELYPLHNEMLKLEAYLGGSRPAEVRDVEVSILHVERFGAWDLDDAILERDYRKAVSVVGAMLEEGVDPLLVLAQNCPRLAAVVDRQGALGKEERERRRCRSGVPPFKGADARGKLPEVWVAPAAYAGFASCSMRIARSRPQSPNVEAYFDMLLWKLVGS